MQQAHRLHSRVALVTGGAHRVGRAIALTLAHAGAHIALHYNRSAEQAQATITDIQTTGVEAIPIQANLATGAPACQTTIDTAIAQWGRLDILVCSASIWFDTPLDTATQTQWDDLFAINTRAPFFLAQAAAPHLRKVQGCIVTIADAAIDETIEHYTPYLASKAALAMMTRNLARELAPDVRVNAVAPGPVLMPDNWDSEQKAKVARSIPLGKLGGAEVIADAVYYLAHASFVTGIVLPVDGGHRLK